MFVKICGITNPADARCAVEAGADALGFICYPPSPRYICPEQLACIVAGVPDHVRTVGVFVDTPVSEVLAVVQQTGLTGVQLHGQEPPEAVTQLRQEGLWTVKAFRVRDAESLAPLPQYAAADAVLLDTWRKGQPGGTGETFQWDLAQHPARCYTLLLSGGLTMNNVSEAVARVAPWGVDTSSGVEQGPGRKAPQLVRAFIANARGAQ